MKFRKRPVVVEARRWQPWVLEMPGVVKPYAKDDQKRPCRACGRLLAAHGLVDTLEGPDHLVCPGDWIITGVGGEHYPCKPDIFARTYDVVLDDEEKQGITVAAALEAWNRGIDMATFKSCTDPWQGLSGLPMPYGKR